MTDLQRCKHNFNSSDVWGKSETPASDDFWECGGSLRVLYMCVDHLSMATSEFSVQHEDLVQEVLEKCVSWENLSVWWDISRMRGFSADT